MGAVFLVNLQLTVSRTPHASEHRPTCTVLSQADSVYVCHNTLVVGYERNNNATGFQVSHVSLLKFMSVGRAWELSEIGSFWHR